MEKLAHLRAFILDGPYGVKKDRLVTFAENGTVRSFNGERNKSFRLTYEANLILTDYRGGPWTIAFAILEWMREHQPDFAGDALSFDADILDTEKVDLGFQIPLSEDVLVTEDETGTHMERAHEPVADPEKVSGWRLSE